MMPHHGLVYLAFCAAVVVAGYPLLLLGDRLFGPSEARDNGIWGVLVVGGLVLVVALAG